MASDNESTQDGVLLGLIESIKKAPELPYFSPEFPMIYLKGMLPLRSSFTGTTREELVGYLEHCTGKTEADFGARVINRLFEEWSGNDLALKQACDGTLLRIASNARTVILAVKDELSLQEIGRRLLWDDNRVIMHSKPKPYGSSETKKRNERVSYEESPMAAAIRGLYEEYRLYVHPDYLVPLGMSPPSFHESSVYPYITSVVTTWNFRFEVDYVSEWKSDHIREVGDHLEVTDHDTVLFLKWLPPQT